MDGNNLSNEAVNFFNRLTGLEGSNIDISKLTSAQRAKFLSWCSNNNIDWVTLKNSKDSIDFPAHLKSTQHLSTDYKNIDSNFPDFNFGIDIQFVNELFETQTIDIKSDISFAGIYTPREIAYADLCKNKFETLTGIFAAKEAIIKASGAKFKGLLSEIEIDYDEIGAPIYSGHRLSISHSNGIAVALAIKSSNSLSIKSQKNPQVINSNDLIQNQINNNSDNLDKISNKSIINKLVYSLSFILVSILINILCIYNKNIIFSMLGIHEL
jgi:phosphopantetheinyl transferase (holo-ACP synthase)